MRTLISVVTPVHIELKEELDYLRELVLTFSQQTYTNKELIISDDLANHQVKELCDEYRQLGLRVTYILGPVRGISSNLNYAIASANGKFIKILFQDDFFTSRFALSLIWLKLRFSKKHWHVCASVTFLQSNQSYSKTFKPKPGNQLLDGINSISSPSVVTFKSKMRIEFRPELNYLMDCEWYLRMSHRVGLPIFGRYALVANRVHNSQATNWAKKNLARESEISREMHNETCMESNKCKCTL